MGRGGDERGVVGRVIIATAIHGKGAACIHGPFALVPFGSAGCWIEDLAAGGAAVGLHFRDSCKEGGEGEDEMHVEVWRLKLLEDR